MNGLQSLLNTDMTILMGWSVLSGVIVTGAVLCVAAVVTLLVGALRPAWFSSGGATARGSRGFALAGGALDGTPLGLVCGLLGGFGCEYVQSLHGPDRFTFAGGSSVGLAMGIACGALGAFALGRLSRRSAWLALGALGGLALGLAVFLYRFGVFAGFGPELDVGVGPEVGVSIGVTGALLGAVLAALLAASRERRRASRNAAAGAGFGALCGLALGAAVWYIYESAFVLPGVAPAYTSSRDAFAGRLYGVALLTTLGALTGALAGAVGTSARWRGVALAVGLALGLLFGLALGLSHGDVGGPPIYARAVSYDPVGSLYGLLGGLLIGALGGAGCALALRWAERQAGRRALLVAVALFALGVLLAIEPLWFHPLFGVDIR